MIAEIALEKTVYSFDMLFSYRIPEGMRIYPGMRVKVPFGRGNVSRLGIVFNVRDNSVKDSRRLKNVLAVLDKEPVISSELIAVAQWMTKRYFCTFDEALRVILPKGAFQELVYSYSYSGIDYDEADFSKLQNRMLKRAKKSNFNSHSLKSTYKISDDSQELNELIEKGLLFKEEVSIQKVGDATDKMVAVKEYDTSKLTAKQREAYEFIQNSEAATVGEVTYFVGCTDVVINNLVKQNAAEFFLREKYRRPNVTANRVKRSNDIFLNELQSKVFNDISDSYHKQENKPILLNGITGSGKTSVYIKLAEMVLSEGKQAIILVPEISLTSQTVQTFRNAFGDKIAILHSGLSVAERYDEWKRCKHGEATIAVGTRSAVFAPFDNIGLIVIDEEHDKSYKSDKNPRYDARSIAILRTARTKAICLLASATPSITSSYHAEKGDYLYCSMNSRYGNADLPTVDIVDSLDNDDFTTELSARTKFLLKKNFSENHQSIILINRRGYHSFVRCSECREVLTCPKCSVSLNYHYDNNKLMCHYCGYTTDFTPTCPSCHQNTMGTSGVGTQRIEENLRELIPEARVLRIDSDSVSLRHNLDEMLDEFAEQKYDIMIGTQMVSKGLNFENVTLVCVLNVDQMLYSDDYNCNERAYDLITQVVGRAGRGRYKGMALIQTEQPENIYIRLAKEQNYDAFYKLEKSFRQSMLYPPFCDINVIGFSSRNEAAVRMAPNLFVNTFTKLLREKLPKHPVRIYSPVEASLYKLNDKYRYKVTIKSRSTKQYRELLSEAYKACLKSPEFNDVSMFIDTNPGENF